MEERPSRFAGLADGILKLFQTIAIITVGIWTFYQYQEFSKKNNDLLIQSKQYELQQQKFLIQQQDLQRAQAELTLKLDQERLASEKVSKQLTQNELKKAQEDRITLTDLQLSVENDGKPFPDGSQMYNVELQAEVENSSSQEFEITYSVIEGFIGSIPRDRFTYPSIARINTPPNIFNYNPDTFVSWRKLLSDAFVYSSTKYQTDWISNMFGTAHRGGGLVADLRERERSSLKYAYLIRAIPNDLVGFVINIGINGGQGGRDVWFFVKYHSLNQSESESTPPNKSLQLSPLGPPGRVDESGNSQ
jgi:hypothetical protein